MANGNCDPTTDDMHREFLLARLRTASLRTKAMDAELTAIGIALKGGAISPETAVRWVKEENMLWLIWPLPEAVAQMVGSVPQVEKTDHNKTGTGDESCEP